MVYLGVGWNTAAFLLAKVGNKESDIFGYRTAEKTVRVVRDGCVSIGKCIMSTGVVTQYEYRKNVSCIVLKKRIMHRIEIVCYE